MAPAEYRYLVWVLLGSAESPPTLCPWNIYIMLLCSNIHRASNSPNIMRKKIPLWVDCMHRLGITGRFGIFRRMAGTALLLAVGGSLLMGAEGTKVPGQTPLRADQRAQVNA